MIILVTKEKVYYSLQFWKTVLYTSWTISLWYNIKRERERERERERAREGERRERERGRERE
jgi:hypothetical protein